MAGLFLLCILWNVLIVLLRLSLLLLLVNILILFSCWLFLLRFLDLLFSLFVWFVLFFIFSLVEECYVWRLCWFTSFWVLNMTGIVTRPEVLLNKVQFNRFNDFGLLYRWTFAVWVFAPFVTIRSSFSASIFGLRLLRIFAWHWFLWPILVRWGNVDVLREITVGHQSVLREVLRQGLLHGTQDVRRVHHVRVGRTSVMLVAWHLDLVHLLLVSLKSIHLVLVVILISNRWRSIGPCLVKFYLRILVLHLLDRTTHLIRIIIRKLGREHETTIAVCGKWLLIITDLIKGELHLSGYDEVVSVFDPHFGQTF